MLLIMQAALYAAPRAESVEDYDDDTGDYYRVPWWRKSQHLYSHSHVLIITPCSLSVRPNERGSPEIHSQMTIKLLHADMKVTLRHTSSQLRNLEIVKHSGSTRLAINIVEKKNRWWGDHLYLKFSVNGLPLERNRRF